MFKTQSISSHDLRLFYVLGELRRVILGLRVRDEDEEVESLYDRMKLDIKNTRGRRYHNVG